jgi:hypothetical protein
MTIERRIQPIPEDARPGGTGTADRRAQAQRELEAQAEERRRALASQTSPLNDPAERIRIWERLHALRLPISQEHRLVAVVAKQTDLTVQQVREEQERRASQATSF